MTIPTFPSPSLTMIRAWVASKIGISGGLLIAMRNSPVCIDGKARAAFLMRQFDYSWSKIADALGYAGHSSAARAARRWERMRGRQAR